MVFRSDILGTNNTVDDFIRSDHLVEIRFVCNIEEIASLYHLPHTNVRHPNILWASAKTAEPPANLPLITDGI